MKLRIGCSLLGLSCLMFLASPVLAGIIRGTLIVPAHTGSAPASMDPYPGRANAMAGMHGSPRGLVTDAVVYVDHVPAATESALAAAATIKPRLAQKGQCFVPRVLAIAAGTRVDFPNLD